jgi:two-component system chemotaxis response regulator CheY
MLTVLLVEDDDPTRGSLREALEGAGHHVTEARDGAEALVAARSASFDLVVTDLQMPRLDGLTLFRQLQVERPSLPVVIMTSFGSSADAALAASEGAARVVIKPFDPEAFAQTIVATVGERHRSRGVT